MTGAAKVASPRSHKFRPREIHPQQSGLEHVSADSSPWSAICVDVLLEAGTGTATSHGVSDVGFGVAGREGLWSDPVAPEPFAPFRARSARSFPSGHACRSSRDGLARAAGRPGGAFVIDAVFAAEASRLHSK